MESRISEKLKNEAYIKGLEEQGIKVESLKKSLLLKGDGLTTTKTRHDNH